MGDVVNLRRARKRKAREIAAADAEGRRAAFGISQVTRKAARDEREIAERRLEAHRLDESTPGRTDDGE